jgi:hypothetical protein
MALLFCNRLQMSAINLDSRTVPERSRCPVDTLTKRKAPSNKRKGLSKCTDSISIYRVSMTRSFICSRFRKEIRQGIFQSKIRAGSGATRRAGQYNRGVVHPG